MGQETWLTLFAESLTNRSMSEQSLQIPLRRNAAWLSFFGLILLAWLLILLGARPGWFVAMDHALAGHVHDGGFWVLLAMWAVMMLAMMLPTLVPTLRVLDGLAGSNGRVWIGLVAGYGAVWLGGAVVFAAAQVLLLWLGHIGAVAFCRRLAIQPNQDDLSGCVFVANGVFSGPLARGLWWRCAHGGRDWYRLCGVLLGHYDAGICRRGDEPVVDGACDFVHGGGKTARRRALCASACGGGVVDGRAGGAGPNRGERMKRKPDE